MAMDKETQMALARIPDQIQKYVTDHSADSELTMGFALRRTSHRKRFSQRQRQFLIGKFIDGEKNKSKFDARQIAELMRETFEPSECLSWQQIASFWSVYGRKTRKENIANDNEDIVVNDKGEILQVPDDEYVSDPNVGSPDGELSDNAEFIMQKASD